ncbi:MAG TPA: hypothetical protein VEG08_08795 [Terriglobales bacterium]|nr:hypothetical protein [Terriglobales bacterium]
MEIAVDGWRASLGAWQAVRNVPREQLPQLTPEQQTVARKMGIPEEDYARSAMAGERTREALLQKTQRLAHALGERIRRSGLAVTVNRVLLRTIEQRFDVQLQVNGRTVPLTIEESIVDDYFDSGSASAEESLGRILDRALASLTA